jgi:hypothetical protein
MNFLRDIDEDGCFSLVISSLRFVEQN